MSGKWRPCDCPHPHNVREGQEVRVRDEGDQPFYGSILCTRGLSGRDYTQLTYALVDPRKKDSPSWPIRWTHHSDVIPLTKRQETTR